MKRRPEDDTAWYAAQRAERYAWALRVDRPAVVAFEAALAKK